MYGCTGVQVPPLSYILFPCPGVCWHALPFSLQLDTSGATRNHLKPSGNYTTLEPPGTYTTLGFSWMCPTPIVPETYGCTGVQVPPFHTFFPTLGYFGMRCHSPYRWILLEPPGTPRILLDVPYPQYLKCMAALVCRSPPLHTFYSHALGCVGVDLPYSQNLRVTIFTHSPYYWKLLEPPGTYTTLGFSWMCPAPSTWQTENQHLVLGSW